MKRCRRSYRDLDEFLVACGMDVDHVTVFRWVQRFTPELIDAARPSRHAIGDRWFVDQTYVKVAGAWRYAYRAVDQHGQVIDVFVARRGDIASARRFFTMALAAHHAPTEVVTGRAPALASVVIRGHAVVQNLRRDHDKPGVEVPPAFRLATAFDELGSRSDGSHLGERFRTPRCHQTQQCRPDARLDE